MTIGRNIKNARIAKGWTQEKLSDESGISKNSISKYESNQVMPRMPQSKAIAKALGITYEELASLSEREIAMHAHVVNRFEDAQAWVEDKNLRLRQERAAEEVYISCGFERRMKKDPGKDYTWTVTDAEGNETVFSHEEYTYYWDSMVKGVNENALGLHKKLVQEIKNTPEK